MLFRGTGPVARAIQWGGRSQYSHAALLSRWNGRWLVAEVREWYGGRIVTLASQVERYSGAIDYFAPNKDMLLRWSPEVATKYMRDLAGCDYGYLAVLSAAIRHLPLLRWLVKPRLEVIDRLYSPPYCSQAVAMAAKFAGCDPCPELDDRLTEPGDLARSLLWGYAATLVKGVDV